ncbi:MAG TPA: O-antigen ligase family protein [Candidatus Binatia bacterium]|nr:O-antigen ligase family protein [Candidatus Binatia bacterium]
MHLACLHLDAAAPADPSPATVGIRNVLLVVVAPTLLAAATLRAGRPRPALRAAAAAFVVLSALAALGVARSPYPFAAAEQVGYLWSYGCLFAVYRWLASMQRPAICVGAIWLAAVGVAVASFHTFVAGNPYGAVTNRLTSFVAPQAFGLMLPIAFSLALIAAERGWLSAFSAGIAAGSTAVASLANGSRQAFVAIVGIWVVASAPRAARAPMVTFAVATLSLVLLWTVAPSGVRTFMRERDPIDLLLFGTSFAETGDAGTLRDRLQIYGALLARISRSEWGELAFGHGTSSSAVVIAEGDVRYRDYDAARLDPNRTAHNEFLRAIYEWGAAGAVALAVVVMTPLLHLGRLWMRTRSRADLCLLAIAAIALLLYSLLGNTLSAASGPLGAALALLYAEIDLRCAEGGT